MGSVARSWRFYDAYAREFPRPGRIPILKARMNADPHLAGDLENTSKGRLCLIFGEPDIDVLPAGDGPASGLLQVGLRGVEVSHPSTGEVCGGGADGIACWFIDADYNEESFFLRHACFLGANGPCKAPKTTLKAEKDSGLGDAPQRYLAPLRPAAVGTHRRPGRLSRRRGVEVFRV